MHSISLLIHLLTLAAGAEALPEVAVVGLHVPGVDLEDAEAVNDRFIEALADSGKVAVVPPEELAGRIQGRESLIIRDAALNRGQEALREGRALFERADTEGAVPLLERAVARLEEGTRAVGDPRELVEAHLLLGLAYASLGDNSSALLSWNEVAILDPSLELDPIRYAPKIVTLFNEARELAAQSQAGALTVTSAGGAAGEVLVDGRPVGPAPAVVEGLSAGTHYVVLDTEDGARHLAVAELLEGEPLDLSVSEQSAALGRPADDPVGRAVQTGELYKALGEYGETALFLVGGVVDGDGGEQVSLSLYAPRSRTFSKALMSDAGDEPASAMLDLVPSLTNYINDSGGIRSDRIAPQVPPLDISANPLLTRLLFDPAPPTAPADEGATDDEGGGRRWLLWTGVGVVAAGGAATAAVLLLSEGDEPSEDNTGTVVLGPIP